jgi:hypothetical protein
MPTYTISEIIGKTLYAKKEVPLYKNSLATTKPYAVVKPGNYIGVLWSWVEQDNIIWLIFKYGANGQFLVKMEPGLIDTSNLAEQGVKTVEQEKKADDQKKLLESGFTGKLEYFIQKYGLYLIGAIIAGQAIKGYLSKK